MGQAKPLFFLPERPCSSIQPHCCLQSPSPRNRRSRPLLVTAVRAGTQRAVDVGYVLVQVDELLGEVDTGLWALAIQQTALHLAVLTAVAVVVETVAGLDRPVAPVIREGLAEVEPGDSRSIDVVGLAASREQPWLRLSHGYGLQAGVPEAAVVPGRIIGSHSQFRRPGRKPTGHVDPDRSTSVFDTASRQGETFEAVVPVSVNGVYQGVIVSWTVLRREPTRQEPLPRSRLDSVRPSSALVQLHHRR